MSMLGLKSHTHSHEANFKAFIHWKILRNFKAFIHWKANEIKVFLLYTGLPILFKYLQTKYFEHFCLYVLIIRRLCDTNIPDKEHDNTKRLLNI